MTQAVLASAPRPLAAGSYPTAIAIALVVLPPLAIMSGMAMTPFLVLLTGLVGAAVWQQSGLDLADFRREARPTLLVCGLLLLIPVLSIGWSITPGRSAYTAAQTVTIMLIGAAGFVIAPRMASLPTRTAAWIFGTLLFTCVVVAIERLPSRGVLFMAYVDLNANFDRFINKNVNRGLCAFAVFVWPVALMLEHAGRKRLAFLAPWIVAVPVAAMHSLSAKMAMVGGFAVYYLVRLAPGLGARLIMIATPAFLVAWPLLFKLLYAPFFTAPEVYQRLPDSSQARVDIWNFVSGKILERPVFGWGLDTSRATPGGDVSYMPGRVYLPLHPHNSVLHLLLETGVAGFALSVIAVVLLLRAWQRLTAQDAKAGAVGGAMIVAYLIVGFSAFGVWQTWWIASGWIGAIMFQFSRAKTSTA